jgi:hypothetical protein
MVLRAFFARRSTHPFWCLKAQPYHPPRPPAVHGSNPKECAKPGTWHQLVLDNLVHCCSAFAHTSNAPKTLDPRCSALGPEPEAPHNGQAIGSGQAAAPIHRHHAAKQYFGLIAPQRTTGPVAPVSTGPPPRVASGIPGGRGEPLAPVKKNEPSPLKQSLQGLECLRGPPGTGFSMIRCLLRTVGVALLYLSVAGRAWRCRVQSLPNYCRLTPSLMEVFIHTLDVR